MKALNVHLFISSLGDCSNNGISSRYDDILLICPEGNIGINEDEPLPENLCHIVERRFGGETYLHIEPVAEPKGVGWMSSGALAYSYDARFGRMSPYPLVLFDRDETQEEYEHYSF